MGMDVWGCAPSSEKGKYFRANIWSWRPIQSLVQELCSDLLDETTLTRIGVNVGAGSRDPAVCREMASRFERWMEHHTSGHELDLGLRVTKDGRFVSEADVAASASLELMTPYRIEDEHLKEWVEFLRDCGGFEVW